MREPSSTRRWPPRRWCYPVARSRPSMRRSLSRTPSRCPAGTRWSSSRNRRSTSWSATGGRGPGPGTAIRSTAGTSSRSCKCPRTRRARPSGVTSRRPGPQSLNRWASQSRTAPLACRASRSWGVSSSASMVTDPRFTTGPQEVLRCILARPMQGRQGWGGRNASVRLYASSSTPPRRRRWRGARRGTPPADGAARRPPWRGRPAVQTR